MKNIISIRELYEEKIGDRVTAQSGIYRWWFDAAGAQVLLSKLSLYVTDNKIQTRKLNGETYYALYFGISKNLKERIEWHTLQKHTLSAVKSGTLSTLRQTLCALLDCDMSAGEMLVNEFIKDHCYWEWEENTTPNFIEEQELCTLAHYYPLNIQKNKSIPQKAIDTLKKLRKEHKK